MYIYINIHNYTEKESRLLEFIIKNEGFQFKKLKIILTFPRSFKIKSIYVYMMNNLISYKFCFKNFFPETSSF